MAVLLPVPLVLASFNGGKLAARARYLEIARALLGPDSSGSAKAPVEVQTERTRVLRWIRGDDATRQTICCDRVGWVPPQQFGLPGGARNRGMAELATLAQR